VAGSTRRTETKRVDGELLIIEEGPAAKNPDNPQSSGINATLYDGQYNLFEKEWRLLNPQVFATIVVITNRGTVPEDKRFGVDDVEPMARTLANANTAGAGCPIASVGGAAGGDDGGNTLVIVGGVGLVAAAAAAAIATKNKNKDKRVVAPDSAAAKVDDDLAILQLDANRFDIDARNPARVTLTGWSASTDGPLMRVPMLLWINVPPGAGVTVEPVQGEGELVATIAVDGDNPSDAELVELVANGVWKGRQMTETITVRLGSDLELRLY
jgi:hypothetical protein